MDKHPPFKIIPATNESYARLYDLFPVPPIINESCDRLYDLVQNRSYNGRLKSVDVADYLGMTVDALCRCIQSGSVPFAFANSKSGRAEIYIPILPFYSWALQRIFGIDSLRAQGEGGKDMNQAEVGQSKSRRLEMHKLLRGWRWRYKDRPAGRWAEQNKIKWG